MFFALVLFLFLRLLTPAVRSRGQRCYGAGFLPVWLPGLVEEEGEFKAWFKFVVAGPEAVEGDVQGVPGVVGQGGVAKESTGDNGAVGPAVGVAVAYLYDVAVA